MTILKATLSFLAYDLLRYPFPPFWAPSSSSTPFSFTPAHFISLLLLPSSPKPWERFSKSSSYLWNLLLLKEQSELSKTVFPSSSCHRTLLSQAFSLFLVSLPFFLPFLVNSFRNRNTHFRYGCKHTVDARFAGFLYPVLKTSGKCDATREENLRKPSAPPIPFFIHTSTLSAFQYFVLSLLRSCTDLRVMVWWWRKRNAKERKTSWRKISCTKIPSSQRFSHVSV